jgi:hypothetical protein
MTCPTCFENVELAKMQWPIIVSNTDDAQRFCDTQESSVFAVQKESLIF